jgi:hypothetical protein
MQLYLKALDLLESSFSSKELSILDHDETFLLMEKIEERIGLNGFCTLFEAREFYSKILQKPIPPAGTNSEGN